jgi:hypothetical protein
MRWGAEYGLPRPIALQSCAGEPDWLEDGHEAGLCGMPIDLKKIVQPMLVLRDYDSV